MINLGKLEQVELRDTWETEAQDFTPWLAQESNLAILADTIGVELELEAQEKSVGPFRADILCKDTATGDWVLIENQLERTDHIHLGQLLTYAAGLQAVTIVWVSARFTDEHRATLDWLNDITDGTFRFFGLEVELWRIGESPAAPKFNIVSKPNDWTRSIGQSARQINDEALSSSQAMQLRYWTALRDHMIRIASPVRSQKPLPQQWTTFGIGRTGFWLAATTTARDGRVGVELYIGHEDAKKFFALLKERQADVEAAVGTPLEWQELPDRKGSRVAVYKRDINPTDDSEWPKQHSWIADMLVRFDAAFRQRIKNLDAAEWTDEADDRQAG